MTKDARIEALRAQLAPCLRSLNAHLESGDADLVSARFQFELGEQFCHSGDIVQGGYVTAMLDGTMAYGLFYALDDLVALPTLELKVSFVRPARAGRFSCVSRAVHVGKSTAFMQAELFDPEGQLLAHCTSTIKMIRDR